MIKTSMRIEFDDKGKARHGITFNRVVYTVGSNEQICMDLRTLAHGIRKRIENGATSKEDEAALLAMYEVAFLEGFRMSDKEIGDMDQEFYDQLLQRLSDGEVGDEETKGFICS